MERLTGRDKEHSYILKCFEGEVGCEDMETSRCDMCENGLIAICDKLADYEDSEEQGILVRLPCKAGDTVFSFQWNIKNGKFEVHAGEVKNVRYDTCDSIVSVSDGEKYCIFGQTIFLNREEAEAALKAKEADNEKEI